MTAPSHEGLWDRVRAALAARSALPGSAATALEIADHVERRLGTNLVRQFVRDFYLPRRYGGDNSGLTDGEAEALVTAIVWFTEHQVSADVETSGSPAAPRPAIAADSRAVATADVTEAVAVGIEELRAAEAEAAAHRAAAERQREENDASAKAERQAALRRAQQDEARRLSAAGDHKAAIAILEGQAQQEPETAVALRRLGDAYRQASDYDQAIRCLRRSLQLDPLDAQAHNSIGICLGQIGQRDAARKAYREALRLKPDLAVVWYNLGRSYEDGGTHREAADSFRRYLDASPSDADGWVGLGRAQYRQESYREALTAFDEALRLEPARASAWAWRGWTNARLRDWSPAASAFAEATRLDPAYRAAWEGQADALKRLGRLPEEAAARAAAARLPAPAAPARTTRRRRGWFIPGCLIGVSALSILVGWRSVWYTLDAGSVPEAIGVADFLAHGASGGWLKLEGLVLDPPVDVSGVSSHHAYLYPVRAPTPAAPRPRLVVLSDRPGLDRSRQPIGLDGLLLSSMLLFGNDYPRAVGDQLRARGWSDGTIVFGEGRKPATIRDQAPTLAAMVLPAALGLFLLFRRRAGAPRRQASRRP